MSVVKPQVIILDLKDYSNWGGKLKVLPLFRVLSFEYYHKLVAVFDPLIIPWAGYRLLISRDMEKIDRFIALRNWSSPLKKEKK